MPLYEFAPVDGNGDLLELFYDMENAPDFGFVVTVDGKDYKRIPSVTSGVHMGFRGFTSIQAPDWDPNASKYDAEGRPYFESRNDVNDYVARSNDSAGKEVVGWEGPGRKQ